MSANAKQLAGREGEIRRAAESLIGDGYCRPNAVPTGICYDLRFILAVLDAERLRITQLKEENRELLETRGDLERQLQEPPTPWNTVAPPKDGTTIIAVGRVIWSDEISTSVDPFVAPVRWMKNQSGYEGWHYDDRGGLAVARSLDDEVRVDWWAYFPKEKRR